VCRHIPFARGRLLMMQMRGRAQARMLELLGGAKCTSIATCLSFSMQRELKAEKFGAGLQGGERGGVWAGS
jgi:hypothetical protein